MLILAADTEAAEAEEAAAAREEEEAAAFCDWVADAEEAEFPLLLPLALPDADADADELDAVGEGAGVGADAPLDALDPAELVPDRDGAACELEAPLELEFDELGF